MTADSTIGMRVKRQLNRVLAPVWCTKCGARLAEQPIGFREQGSRYTCPSRVCPAYGLPLLVYRRG